MAEEVRDGEARGVALFNGALETGVRAVIVLDAAYPRCFDLARLTWCDHLVVHTADIGGPPACIRTFHSAPASCWCAGGWSRKGLA